MTAALATAWLPSAALAQEAPQASESIATFASPLADAPWMKPYAPLDEDTLGRQRGRAPGYVTVSTASQMAAGSNASVTLWDEITPPAPLPIPVDTQRAVQGNSASYTRK
ncbi:hypothetical protein WL21_07500 [Burkholderia ubonensis]|nr:hypothetical protein WJ81_23700 [Burkholderia ubonensis]KVZ65058.1 hypothetical protein WL20_11580 [Burkholderia ubonensis]KVZ71786.1 hypothetical protein WL21_07500 [Burkholderia ubonensis]KWC13742.1 hypothetical protein WL46_02710 [Burkholderia ubonensis]